jgi:hypothetical protein
MSRREEFVDEFVNKVEKKNDGKNAWTSSNSFPLLLEVESF